MATSPTTIRRERLISGQYPAVQAYPGVQLRTFASAENGSVGFSTGLASIAPGGHLPYHTHPFTEVITALHGDIVVEVQGRSYNLQPFDAIHVPAEVEHEVKNASDEPAAALWAFASARTERNLTEKTFHKQDRRLSDPLPDDPETIRRFLAAEEYELAPNAWFRDLFGSRFGAAGICGGYGTFRSGASLPCHFHEYDESITIVSGHAVCLVEGSRHALTGYDTALIPKGRVHRFINMSESDMAMIWVYAGGYPERTIVDSAYCSGESP